MLTVKIWNRFKVVVDGQEITMEVKRLRYSEATPLLLALSTAYQIRGDLTPEATKQERLKATQAFLEALPPALIQEVFSKYVRKVDGVESEEGPADTGEKLYELADSDIVLEVLYELQRLAYLTQKEADFFASPSTSSSIPAPGPSSSDAPPIEGEGGPPTTATPTPPAIVSSIAAE